MLSFGFLHQHVLDKIDNFNHDVELLTSLQSPCCLRMTDFFFFRQWRMTDFFLDNGLNILIDKLYLCD